MVQQTQVLTVIPYYLRFMQRFATVQELANADQDEVLHLWTGLGYYARARNLHKCAQQLVAAHQGEFPTHLDEVMALSGIGRSTAAAILSLSRNQKETILDGNVKRVLTRYFAIEQWAGLKAVETDLWAKAVALTPDVHNAQYTQAMMDMGATLCTRSKPKCEECPVADGCLAHELALTASIPASKPKKEKPIKTGFWFVAINDLQQILVQQRPASGIWGGLHVFPQFASLEQLTEHAEQLGCCEQLKHAEHWPIFRHTFSHYHFDIQVVCLQVNQAKLANHVANNQQKWISLLLENETLGLAAPVVSVIEKLRTRIHL